MTRHPLHLTATLLSLVIASTACNSPSAPGQELLAADAIQAQRSDGLVFLTMRITPEAHMEALFEGAVVRDEAGCLRLDSPDAATVVWPRGWSFEQRDDALRILNAAGQLAASVGEQLTLPGGEVETLPSVWGFTQADRDLAGSQCPGRYWIVGDAD
jgi:hypothetical protein